MLNLLKRNHFFKNIWLLIKIIYKKINYILLYDIYVNLTIISIRTLSTPYKFLHMTSYHTQWKLNKYNPNKIQVVPLSYIRQNNKVTSTISSGIYKYKKTDDTEYTI